MVQDNIFALLSRGAYLHKCSASLDSPLLQKRHQREQQPHEPQPAEDGRTKGQVESAMPCSAESVRARHSIAVKGLNVVPSPFLSFGDQMPTGTPTADARRILSDGDQNSEEGPSRLPAWLVSRLHSLGYKHPTPIQMQALPLLLKGHHMLASAPTGSGKTLAFLLPLIACLKAPRNAFGRLVVLSPTRELARQSLRTFEKLTGKRLCIRLLWNALRVEFGSDGTGFKAAFPQSHPGARYGAADAVFATPLSLLTLLREKRLLLTDCNHLVLDEADRLLDSDFSPQVDAILSELKSAASSTKRLHICLFSATLPPSVVLLAESIAYGAVHLSVGRASAAAPQIEQELVFCTTEAAKLWALKTLRLERRLIPPCLIFVETQERASELLKEMLSEGMPVDLLHAAKSKQQRDATVDAFRIGKIWFLICTDLVARGIDFKSVALVINFDLPASTSVYIHRIGRTGRAGKEGKALTFFTLEDVPRLRPIVQIMQKSPNSKIPSFLRSKLTRNLKVKGHKNYRSNAPIQRLTGSRRRRKPIRPIARAVAMKAKRRSWAISASLAKKKRAKATETANVEVPEGTSATAESSDNRDGEAKDRKEKKKRQKQAVTTNNKVSKTKVALASTSKKHSATRTVGRGGRQRSAAQPKDKG